MNIEHYTRVGRLLAELHGDEVLSEQQCAKIMGVDLVSWRIIEHTFCRGSWGETIDESGPTSEEAILAALPATQKPSVWYGSMPESNGKTNWTAILHKGDIAHGMTIDRSEYPDRVRYEADRVRWLIGELAEEPFILDYDADKHSGYVAPPAKLSTETVDKGVHKLTTERIDSIRELFHPKEMPSRATVSVIARAVLTAIQGGGNAV